ncbi:carbohydrate binding family 9 domain-containing protein [candidate division WOR-3 bacterium]|nr:carbohydrate binding family 9 domain-containing protein [candidate division WOR-3 bacterium]
MLKLLWLVLIPSIVLAHVQEPIVRAVRVIKPPFIDGELNDSCWQECKPVTDFYMIEPNPGAPVTQQTVVYVCYDDEKIYFGIHMSEDKPDAIQSTVTQRDGGVYMDDSFELMLDTYCDRRNAYYFMSNFLGAKLDGRIIDDGRDANETWDAHWETKAQRVEDGWEMEIAIPFSELNFPRTDSLVWGINFWRIERPHWENTSFSMVQLWCKVSQYGTLTGLSIKPQIKRFEILPYGAFRCDEDSLTLRGGVDFEYDVTSDLIFNATFWPDFAQIEADPYRFNLSYEQGEELYYPEKRPFFLEGSSILRTPIQLFYTRRMNEILLGGKLYGKIKSTEVLALNVQTKDTEENFSVLRIKQELFTTTTLGALVTHKQRSDTFSQAASIDFNHPVYGPFLLTSQFSATRNTGVSGDQWAGHIGIASETGTYGGGLFAGRYGPDFRVEQGFINACDINRQGISGVYWYKCLRDKGISKWLEVGAEFDVAQEIGDKLACSHTEFWSNFVMSNKWRIGINGERNYERYGESEFKNRLIGLHIESNVGGMTGIASSFTFGRLYNSSFRFFHFGFLIQPIQRITIFPYFQTVRSGKTKWQWITNTRISYKATDKAFFRIFLQADSETDSEIEETFSFQDIQNLNANFLFSYEFAPGTILYLVYNHPRNFSDETVDNIFVAKFTYSFRF